jgi:hypothetical protein
MFRRRDNTGAAPPKREGRAARVVRWAGTVVCGGIVLVFLLSMGWWMAWFDGSGGEMICEDGAVGVRMVDWLQLKAQLTIPAGSRPRHGAWHGHSTPTDVLWWPHYASVGKPAYLREIWVPLWIPFAAAALPTGLLWRAQLRRRRRVRVGLCPACGYDRAGIAPDAACPECGKVPTRG